MSRVLHGDQHKVHERRVRKSLAWDEPTSLRTKLDLALPRTTLRRAPLSRVLHQIHVIGCRVVSLKASVLLYSKHRQAALLHNA